MSEDPEDSDGHDPINKKIDELVAKIVRSAYSQIRKKEGGGHKWRESCSLTNDEALIKSKIYDSLKKNGFEVYSLKIVGRNGSSGWEDFERARMTLSANSLLPYYPFGASSTNILILGHIYQRIKWTVIVELKYRNDGSGNGKNRYTFTLL